MVWIYALLSTGYCHCWKGTEAQLRGGLPGPGPAGARGWEHSQDSGCVPGVQCSGQQRWTASRAIPGALCTHTMVSSDRPGFWCKEMSLWQCKQLLLLHQGCTDVWQVLALFCLKKCILTKNSFLKKSSDKSKTSCYIPLPFALCPGD